MPAILWSDRKNKTVAIYGMGPNDEAFFYHEKDLGTQWEAYEWTGKIMTNMPPEVLRRQQEDVNYFIDTLRESLTRPDGPDEHYEYVRQIYDRYFGEPPEE